MDKKITKDWCTCWPTADHVRQWISIQKIDRHSTRYMACDLQPAGTRWTAKAYWRYSYLYRRSPTPGRQKEKWTYQHAQQLAGHAAGVSYGHPHGGATYIYHAIHGHADRFHAMSPMYDDMQWTTRITRPHAAQARVDPSAQQASAFYEHDMYARRPSSKR